MTMHALQRISERAPNDNPALVMARIRAGMETMPIVSETVVAGHSVRFLRTPSGVPLFPVTAYGICKTVLGEGMSIEAPAGTVVLEAPDDFGKVPEKPSYQIPEDLEDGIHFALDQAVYHRLPRLSMSGIQRMLTSPADFWSGSWLNPAKLAKEEEDQTKAQILGAAYHMARFEPHLFDKYYCRRPSKDEAPVGTLFTDKEITAKLEEMGLPKTRSGEVVLDKAMRLIDAGYQGKVWHYEMEMFERTELGERTPLDAAVYDQIIADVAAMHASPDILPFLQDGEAEVSVLWTCPETGIRMKARFDYLRPTGFTDFKTFENSMGRELSRNLFSAYQYNRYYIQAVGYWQAAEIVRTGTLPIVGTATDGQRDLIERIRANKRRMTAHYVWQQKGGVPNLICSPIGLFTNIDTDPNAAGLSEENRDRADAAASPTALHHKGALEIRRAKDVFRIYGDVYAPGEPWLPLKPVIPIDDASFSGYWLEEAWGG